VAYENYVLTVENYFGPGAWATSGTGKEWTPATRTAVEKALLMEVTDAGGKRLRILHPKVSLLPSKSIAVSVGKSMRLPIKATALVPDTGSVVKLQALVALAAA
jgi:hypothetical protein